MAHRKTSKRSKARTMLRLADLEQSKNAVLHSLGAASSQESYGHVGEAAPIEHYKIIAQPAKRLSRSQRSYYTDETGVIRFTEEKREPANTDPPLEPPNER